MCLIGWAWRPGTPTPLWIAANRDEAWDRPAVPLRRWRLPDGTVVLSGRDQLAGGAWLAFGAGGRLAMLTNVRAGSSAARPAPRSRGLLVTGWLGADARVQDWHAWLRGHPASAYEGCNLVLADVATGQWRWLTNVDPRGRGEHWDDLEEMHGWWGADVPVGVHALSNAALDTPWPKAERLHAALEAVAAGNCAPPKAEAALRAVLQTHVPCPQGDPAALTRSPWVHGPQRRYGTRSSLIAWLDSAGTLHATEWTYAPELGPDGIPHASVRRRSIHWCGMPTSS